MTSIDISQLSSAEREDLLKVVQTTLKNAGDIGAVMECVLDDPIVAAHSLLRENNLVTIGTHLLFKDFKQLTELCVRSYFESFISGHSLRTRLTRLQKEITQFSTKVSTAESKVQDQIKLDAIRVDALRIAEGVDDLMSDEDAKDQLRTLFATFHAKADGRFVFEFAKRWAQCAFPRAIVGHKLAASFMATGVDATVIEHVVSPWPAWSMIVPNTLVSVLVDDHEEDVERLLVLTSGDVWRICAMTRTTQMWKRGPLIDLLANDTPDESMFAKAPDGRDARAWNLLTRYAIGLCLELGEPSVMTAATRQRERQVAKREPGAAPAVWKFELRRDVVVDCREAIRDYVTGARRSAPTVQILVRGHWKRQACGPGRAQRKMIHIEPYWRGPEDAPIAVRGHDVR